MTVDAAVADHYARRERLVRAVVARMLALWQAGGAAGFRDLIDLAAQLLAAGQFTAALLAADYVADIVAVQGGHLPRLRPDPRAFAGVTASGRSLSAALTFAVNLHTALTRAGAPTPELSARVALARITGNEVAQAAVNTTQVAVTADDQVVGYTRTLRGPSCSRCAVLAGRVYAAAEPFQRHPGCDCLHVPRLDAPRRSTRPRRDAGGGLTAFDTSTVAAAPARPTVGQVYAEHRSRRRTVDALHRGGYLTERA